MKKHVIKTIQFRGTITRLAIPVKIDNDLHAYNLYYIFMDIIKQLNKQVRSLKKQLTALQKQVSCKGKEEQS